MGICPDELRHYVIKPTLDYIDMWSPFAENLLLGTAAQESGLGFYLKRRKQRSLGIYCITPMMHKNIWDRYLVKHSDLASKIRGLASQHEFLANPHAELATNLSYATAIAWLIYKRNQNFIESEPSNIYTLAKCWRRFYHVRPQAHLESFIQHYQTLILNNSEAA
ncbi:hypothetical protein [Zooshikella harenae]|uniref:Uncharacterized protein n=1 Tax=Zooshikella harenae TaxID=2827238 RepID=A0ABS5ZA79_9GAMM|nr:hypothetical protein [Zooshikella harenae]MBU2709812.1 hypothetical protein [Zooshikella harenae]